MDYYKTISFTGLPSTHIYKLESLTRDYKLFDLIRPNTLAVIYPELNLIWYDKEWFPFFFPKEQCKEIILGIRENDKIEFDDY